VTFPDASPGSWCRSRSGWPGSIHGINYVWHFTGPTTAQQRTAAHPGTFVISLGDAAELARRHAARALGGGYATRRDCLTEQGETDE
jgi:hypothetical protein